ncbi:MAG TPA: hypothetical protein VGB22_03345 [candidate division Zixibacteria bacterium]
MRAGSHASWLLGVALVILGVVAGASSVGAQEEFGSATLQALGGVYTIVPGEPSVVWLNSATMANGAGGVEVSYRRLFDLEQMDEVVASAFWRVNPWLGLGGGGAHFGESGLYEEFRAIGAASVRALRSLRFGVALEYQREEYGSGNAVFSGLGADLSASWRLHESWIAAIGVRRLALDEIYDGIYNDANPGVIFDASVAWSLPPELTIGGRWFREDGGADRFSLGQRLRLVDGIDLLTGLRFDPIRYSLGGRISLRGVRIDYAYISHSELGGTHGIGIAWCP